MQLLEGYLTVTKKKTQKSILKCELWKLRYFIFYFNQFIKINDKHY